MKVDVVVGNQNCHTAEIIKLSKCRDNINLYFQVNNIADIMQKADLAIGAGGSNTWERMLLGIPSLVIGFADNQKILLKDLFKYSLVNQMDEGDITNVKSLKKRILNIIDRPDIIDDQIKKGKKIVGNNGTKIILNMMTKMNLKISILSDEDSWINRKISEYISSIRNHFKTVSWVHKVNHVPPGDICIMLGCGQIMKRNSSKIRIT